MTVDDNGKLVLSFTTKARNLSRVAELTDSIIQIAQSGAWRDYEVATGRERWREAELDYFLIACDLQQEDVSNVLAWNKESATLAPMMDDKANSNRRRPLDVAAAEWHSPTGESFVARASRLGWLRKDGKLASPVPHRARVKAEHGVTMDERARRGRKQRIPADRLRVLDAIADDVLTQTESAIERRYLIDRLAANRPGRKPSTANQLAAWRADAERLDWNTATLAEHWNVARRTARDRVHRLRADAA